MKKTWWLRIVGGFYLMLALTSLWVLFVNPQLFGRMFPFSADALSIRAFSAAWLIFVLELGVLGVIMLYYARDSTHNRILVLTVSTANYIPFMFLHLLIAGTGFYFLRQDPTGR